MYQPDLLRAGFSEVVGYLQANVPTIGGIPIPQITAPLTVSESGIYVQDKHPLVSLENIFAAAPDFNLSNYPVWISGSNYNKGVAVNDTLVGALYTANSALVNDVVAPSLDNANWTPFNPFQSYLLQKFNQSVTNLFSEVVKLFKLQDKGKAIIEKQQLFRGGGSRYTTIIGDGSFVGFEILTQQAEALIVQIDAIGLQFTQSQSLNFYLYHSANPGAPLKVIPVNTAANSNFVWSQVVNVIMQYLQQNTQGTYIAGYFQNDLINGNQAISKSWDCSSVPCSDCDGADLLMYNRWSRYTAFRNIKVPNAFLNGTALPNLNNAVYNSVTNWGLNFSLTVRCDLTDFILRSKFYYSDALAMQLCLEHLRSIAQSSRIETTLAQIKNQARQELNLQEKSTFINQYWNTVRALEADMSGFSNACQPDNKSGKGGKWRTV